MPSNTFPDFVDSPSAPATDAFAITPDDNADLGTFTKALYVGGAGDVKLRAVAGVADVTFKNLPAGAILDVRVRAVRATGTTATSLVALV